MLVSLLSHSILKALSSFSEIAQTFQRWESIFGKLYKTAPVPFQQQMLNKITWWEEGKRKF